MVAYFNTCRFGIHKHRLMAIAIVVSCLTVSLISGCAMFMIRCSKVFIPFTARAVDEHTGQPITGAMVYSG